MATQFSGGTYVNTTLSSSTKALLIADIQAKLTTAGWTVISGGGTTNVLMQTAQAPGSLNQGRVRFKDNGGTCVQVTLQNVSGTKVQTSSTTNGGHLAPLGAGSFQILASQYRFEIFRPGALVNRDFVIAGILFIPTPYQGVVTEAIYLQSNSVSDSDTTNRASFRYYLGANDQISNGSCCGICNGNMFEHSNVTSGYKADVSLRVSNTGVVGSYTGGAGNTCANLYRWYDLAIDSCDPLMGWGLASTTDEAMLYGQPFDWTCVGDSFTVDTTDTWSEASVSHTWWCLTYANTGNQNVRGSIFVATS